MVRLKLGQVGGLIEPIANVVESDDFHENSHLSTQRKRKQVILTDSCLRCVLGR